MAEYSGRGDPERSMALLWGGQRPPTRGPKPALSVERIVSAAIAVADAEGLAALSMRRIADALGVGTMSLYTYVPGKAELLDVMLDTVVGEVRMPDQVDAGWRTRLEARAREDLALYRRHPWVLQVSGARAVLGPNETALFEASLGTVAGIGLTAREMVLVVSLIAGYARGAAQGVVDAAQAEQQTGVSDDDWWAAREPVFDRYFDVERFPLLVEMHGAGAFEPIDSATDYNLGQALDSFDFGLHRVLDGITAFVASRTPTPGAG